MNVMTIASPMCNHFFCTLSGKNSVASFMVTQNWANGNSSTTICCESDFLEMNKVLKATDTVTVL